MLLLLASINLAQEKTKQNAPAKKDTTRAIAAATKDTTKKAAADTVVARTTMIAILKAQRDNLQRQAEGGLTRFQGMIDAFEIQLSDSVRVPKNLLTR
jgi:hypothetical protein